MLSFTLSRDALLKAKTDGYALFLAEGFASADHAGLTGIIKELFPPLEVALAQQKFTGKIGDQLVIPVCAGDTVKYLIFVGVGKQGGDVENVRRAAGRVINAARAHKLNSLACALSDAATFGASAAAVLKQVVIAFELADYSFDEFRSDAKGKDAKKELSIVLCDASENAQRALDDARVIGEATNLARRWIDMPPSFLTPCHLTEHAQAIAKESGLKITTFGEKEVNQMGMGGLAGVSKGSHEDCQLVIMEYHVSDNAPTLGFVGKGITFDSGGLSLKPPQHMETMKEDMSGAAAVICAMKALAQLKPKVNIVAITALAENLPSGTATKPGDVVRFYNGKTAEIKNTDAEGRLVLADALAYAVKHYKLDMMIDLATLTGACAYALGAFYSGMMSMHDDAVAHVEDAAKSSGDRVWRLPLHDDYEAAIKTPMADICNIGKRQYMAGTITAARFLKHFVGDVPWVHLDIAGTAYNVPDMPYFKPGATGVGVRLLIDLAMNWQK